MTAKRALSRHAADSPSASHFAKRPARSAYASIPLASSISASSPRVAGACLSRCMRSGRTRYAMMQIGSDPFVISPVSARGLTRRIAPCSRSCCAMRSSVASVSRIDRAMMNLSGLPKRIGSRGCRASCNSPCAARRNHMRIRSMSSAGVQVSRASSHGRSSMQMHAGHPAGTSSCFSVSGKSSRSMAMSGMAPSRSKRMPTRSVRRIGCTGACGAPVRTSRTTSSWSHLLRAPKNVATAPVWRSTKSTRRAAWGFDRVDPEIGEPRLASHSSTAIASRPGRGLSGGGADHRRRDQQGDTQCGDLVAERAWPIRGRFLHRDDELAVKLVSHAAVMVSRLTVRRLNVLVFPWCPWWGFASSATQSCHRRGLAFRRAT